MSSWSLSSGCTFHKLWTHVVILILLYHLCIADEGRCVADEVGEKREKAIYIHLCVCVYICVFIYMNRIMPRLWGQFIFLCFKERNLFPWKGISAFSVPEGIPWGAGILLVEKVLSSAYVERT